MEIGEVLWIEYDYLTELYDRSLPHVMSKYGEAIVRPDYYNISVTYATFLRSIMRNEFQVYGNLANNFYKNLTFERISELYRNLDYHPLTNSAHGKREVLYEKEKTAGRGKETLIYSFARTSNGRNPKI